MSLWKKYCLISCFVIFNFVSKWSLSKKNKSILRLIFIFFNDSLIYKFFFSFLNIMNLTYLIKFSMSFKINVAKTKKWKFKFNHSMTINILIVNVFSMCDSSKIFSENFSFKFANHFESLASKFDSLMLIFFFLFFKTISSCLFVHVSYVVTININFFDFVVNNE